MWIMLNNAFLSIVEPNPRDPAVAGADLLLVRARVKGHIENVFPDAVGVEVPGRDYQFRAYLPRQLVADAIARNIAGIRYPNFKDSVKDGKLHSAYACVWGVMAQEQAIPPYETKARVRKRFPVDPRRPYSND
jgi:hypothetical protein